MADKDEFNDEYQFADMDAINSEPEDTGVINDSSSEATQASPQTGIDKSIIKKRAMIAVGVLLLVVVLYKIIGAIYSTKTVAKTDIPTLTAAPQPPVIVQPAPVVPAPAVDDKITQELSALELSQQTMSSDVSSVNAQLGTISQNMNAMIAKITELNGIIVSLSTKVDEQSRELEQITIRREQAKKAQHHVAHKGLGYPKYFLQAVIPGRAWLIATNGATLTVREGTVVAGYGMVKLIDSNQGRVTTSSGQVIKFSQEDS